jgi:lysozyme
MSQQIADALLNLIGKADLLIVFLGMMALVWRSLGIAHDLSSLALKGQQPQPTPAKPVPAPKPVPLPVPTPMEPEAPLDDTAVDQGLVDFIKKMEGFAAKAYWDYKQWSIGYGTKATSSTETISQADAEVRLRQEIAKADKLVTDFAPGLPKGVHQALLDLTYNAGSGWEHQSLGAAVKAQKWETVKADILQYNHAGGQVNAGLTHRREAEVSWFDNPL